MVDSLPTGSINGRQDWEWNRLYADRRTRCRSRGRKSSEGRRREQPVHPPRVRAGRPVPHETQSLHTELERKERRLQFVITHYERLLAEKNRLLAEDVDPRMDHDWKTAVLAPIRRIVARL